MPVLNRERPAGASGLTATVSEDWQGNERQEERF